MIRIIARTDVKMTVNATVLLLLSGVDHGLGGQDDKAEDTRAFHLDTRDDCLFN